MMTNKITKHMVTESHLQNFCDIITTNWNEYCLKMNYDKTIHDDIFVYQTGPKWAKVWCESPSNNGSSIVAFINMENGDIFKPASYKKPANGVRGNLFSQDEGREALGGYNGCCIRYLR